MSTSHDLVSLDDWLEYAGHEAGPLDYDEAVGPAAPCTRRYSPEWSDPTGEPVAIRIGALQVAEALAAYYREGARR